MSLVQVQALAAEAGLAWEMRFRPGSSPIPVPSIVHLRADHYVALVKQETGRYLMVDPAQGGEKWISREALDDEASGYVLAPRSATTAGWRLVPVSEGSTVIGHCLPGAPDDDDPCDCPSGGGGPGNGMPTYSVQQMPASLRV